MTLYGLLLNLGSFKADSNNPEINLKRIIYFVCLGNFVIKACLIAGLNDIKRKKLNQRYQLYEYNNYEKINKKK